MRKFGAFALMMVMAVAVFTLSGCGGGSLDPDKSYDEETPSIPNNSPDTYDTEKVLEGSWQAVDSEYTFQADDFSFRLNAASLTFSSTDIKGTVAQSKVSSHQEWYSSYTSSDVRTDLGVNSLGLDFASKTGTMIHQGKDRWRCNIGGDNKVLMNIVVSSDTLISVNYQGVSGVLFQNTKAEYNFTLNFRKEEYSR